MQMRLIWIIIPCCLFFATESAAQKILLLEKTKKFKRIRHFQGDHLAFRVDNERYAIAGEIEAILDHGIIVGDKLYMFENITMVLNYQKFAVFRRLSTYAFYAIPPMLVYTMLHRGLNTGEQPLLDRNSLQVVGVFAGIGVILWPFKARKYRLGNKWQLRVIDVTPG
jgi:hypothetical protein